MLLDILLIMAGVAVIASGIGDLTWTTLSTSGGGGPITSRLAHYLWEMIRLPRRFARRHQMMRLWGLTVVGVMIITWIVLVWLGWALVFAGGEQAVVWDTTGRPANWWEKVYFAGTTVSTLGPGDLVAGGPVWQTLTATASLSGLLVATLAITYLVPVVGAVTHHRQVALQIAALGEDPFAVAARLTRADRRGDLAGYLTDLTGSVQRLAQQHLTYPALHYFHDVQRETAGPVQIAVLDEALTILMLSSDEAEPGATTLDLVRAAVSSFLGTLTAAYIATAEEPPERPDPRRLAEAGIRNMDDREFGRRLDELAERRSALLGLIEDDGWEWSDVYPRGPGKDDSSDKEAPPGSLGETPERSE